MIWDTKQVLTKIAEAGGEVSAKHLDLILEGVGRRPSTGNLFHHRVIRPGYAEWVRNPRNPTGAALGVKLTDRGRDALGQVTPSCGCVFCDLKLPLHKDAEGFHHVAEGERVQCALGQSPLPEK